MRFKAESIVNGKVLSDETDYLSLEELKDLSPETYQAILNDASCVGAFLKHEAGRRTLITDRDRFSEYQRQSCHAATLVSPKRPTFNRKD